MSAKQRTKWKFSVWLAQNKKCCICHGPLGYRFTTHEHVIPWHFLATTNRKNNNKLNRLVSHLKCNKERGGAMPTQFELDYLSAINIIMEYEERNNAKET